MSDWRIRLHRTWRKHRPELQALTSGELPRWLAPGAPGAPTSVPVFVFHDVAPAPFEASLRFLADNGYRTLTADELADLGGRAPDGERLVVLTFDDALWSVRAVAFPLLREYGFDAVLFVVPGVIGEEEAPWPDLADVHAGRASLDDLRARSGERPFCTWSELAEMSASAVVDVQSHSLSHQRVPISPRVLGFVHPGLDFFHGNLDLPVSTLDDEGERIPRPGAPIFASASRLSGERRFLVRPELVRALVDRVASRGADAFFASRRWHRELRAELREWPLQERGRFESDREREEAVRREIAGARRTLERRLGDVRVRHLAYPWHTGGSMADRLAAEENTRSVHYGPSIASDGSSPPLRVRRLPGSYLPRLPGEGRESFAAFLRDRAGRIRWPFGGQP